MKLVNTTSVGLWERSEEKQSRHYLFPKFGEQALLLLLHVPRCMQKGLPECRPMLFFDGCHIKVKFGGIIFAAVGIDPNDSIYPIALVVVEIESKASWKWFLQTLKTGDLGIVNTYP